MDTNCLYSSHLRNLAGDSILDSLECYLGLLHSKAGHDMRCQLQYSGLYAEGFGRAIGENAEQLHVSSVWDIHPMQKAIARVPQCTPHAFVMLNSEPTVLCRHTSSLRQRAGGTKLSLTGRMVSRMHWHILPGAKLCPFQRHWHRYSSQHQHPD